MQYVFMFHRGSTLCDELVVEVTAQTRECAGIWAKAPAERRPFIPFHSGHKPPLAYSVAKRNHLQDRMSGSAAVVTIGHRAFDEQRQPEPPCSIAPLSIFPSIPSSRSALTHPSTALVRVQRRQCQICSLWQRALSIFAMLRRTDADLQQLGSKPGQ